MTDSNSQTDDDREPTPGDRDACAESSDDTGDTDDLSAMFSDGGSTASGETVPEPDRERAVEDNGSGRDIVTYVEWAAFGILCLLALVATFRFYFAASEAIRVWFSPDFVPVFQAVFNLVVLVASAVGISILVRRIA
jgi:hypothetical protein